MLNCYRGSLSMTYLLKMSGDEIVNCIVNQNLPHASIEDVKLVYLYPAAKKKARSCVVELKADHRLELMKRRGVNINWLTCRIDDHVTVTQCFNCAGFGHIANACANKASCHFCAAEYSAKECPNKAMLNCVNCAAAKFADRAHAANDRLCCPALRRRIDRKISSTNYGCE